MTAAAVSTIERSRILLPLANGGDERQTGGKAANLARLMALPAPVPPGVVLPCEALEAFGSASALGAQLHAVCRTIDDASTPSTLESVAASVRALVMAAPMPQPLLEAIDAAARRLMADGPIVVRSSAVGEDGAAASFAGQFDSILNVNSIEQLRLAVRSCYASQWSARALFYRRARNVSARGMAIVIQHQVQARAAGVLFTRNPQPDAEPDTLVLEYCAGLADALVSGHIDPARLTVNRTSAGIVHEEGAVGLRTASVRQLVVDRLQALVRLSLTIEDRFGAPQDIEWAIDESGSIWIVQTRPITAHAASAHAPSVQASVLWTNANVNENFPRPISPFLYSFASSGYYHYFRNLGLAFGISRRRLRAMERPLRAIIGVHGARMYYNLTNIHAVLRMAPYGEQLARAFNTFVGTDDVTDARQDAPSRGQRRTAALQGLELVRIGVFTFWQYAFLKHRVARFERIADAFAERTQPAQLKGASLQELGTLLQSFVGIRYHRWKNASLADAAAMVTYAALGRLLRLSGFDAAIQTRLLRALPNVPSSKPARELWKLSRAIRRQPELLTLFERASATETLTAIRSDARFAGFRQSFDAFLDAWGFRSSAELMLTEPSLQERPEPAIDLLRQYAASDGESPEAVMSRQSDERRRDTRRVLKIVALRSPLRALSLWLVLRWTQRAVAYRERARLKQALLYTRCRRVALAIGDVLVSRRQLAAKEDVFMLTVAEIDELTSGRAMFASDVPSLVALRQRQHESLRQLSPPDTFRLPDGEVFAAGATVLADAMSHHRAASGAVLSGTTACGGRVSARAAVLSDLNEASRLERGDILVTRQTDPGWGPVFCLVSGLVIERGGMLSHGAIIAREFGLPCIVSVKHATTRIAHGSRLCLDADRGVCQVEAVGGTEVGDGGRGRRSGTEVEVGDGGRGRRSGGPRA